MASSKNGTPTSAGLSEKAQSPLAGKPQTRATKVAANAAATGHGKQAGTHVQTLKPEVFSTGKKDGATVGDAECNVHDGAEKYGDQAQKGVGSGVDDEQAGAYLDMLESELPAKIEEIKSGNGQKEDEHANDVTGGVKKFK